jgi:hypothetical protein
MYIIRSQWSKTINQQHEKLQKYKNTWRLNDTLLTNQ